MASRKNIDFNQVLQTAVTLADEGGFESVTLASVASQLGIRIPSLYNYVQGLAGLRYEMTIWGVKQLTEHVRRAAVGKSGEAAIFSVATALRSFAITHPGIYAVTQRASSAEQPELVAAQTEAVEILVVILEPFGFEADDRLHAVRALRSLVHGFVDLEITGGFGMPLDRDTSFHYLMEIFVNGLRERLVTTNKNGGA